MKHSQDIRKLHIQIAASGFGSALLAVMIVRLVLADLSLPLLFIFGTTVLGCLSAFLVSRLLDKLDLAGYIMLAVFCLALLAGVYLAGGVTQPIAIVAPGIPMFATILMGARWGWLVLAIISLCYCLFGYLQIIGYRFPVNSLAPHDADVMRVVYILFTALVITIIASLVQSQTNQRADKLTEIAHEDFLTRTLNRRGFDIALRREFLRAKRNDKPLSLLLLDVDHFKQYNDAYGHARGDDCLVAITDAVSGCLRRPGDSLSRIGGDEFAAILPNTDIKGAFGVAQQICDRVNKLGLTSPTQQVTVTIGISEMRVESQVSDYQLVHEADRALYKAKQAGRNQVKVAAQDKVVNIASANIGSSG